MDFFLSFASYDETFSSFSEATWALAGHWWMVDTIPDTGIRDTGYGIRDTGYGIRDITGIRIM
jgi:hypothetical protein